MRNILIITLIILAFSTNSVAQELAPYIKIGETSESIKKASDDIITALKNNGFTVLGTYNPSKKSTLKIIAFTQNDLKNTVIKVKDRGALAAVFKVGLVASNGKVTMSYTNPEYILRAYLGDNYKTYKSNFEAFSKNLKAAFSSIGSDFTSFGGTVEAEDLGEYHYKIMMPYFSDPIELKEFSSFEEGVRVIEKNLAANKGNTKLVFTLKYTSEKIAVFGIGLEDKEEGESYFLPIIGEAHVAALPYEIILQGKEATMLHGKYRLALHWPELTMGTFMKIMGTPGDIEYVLEALCE